MKPAARRRWNRALGPARPHWQGLRHPPRSGPATTYDRPVARTGRCLCGEVTYELGGDLIATAVCHCEHCQRQSGSAFSVNLIAHESQLTVQGALQTYEERGEHGDAVYVRRRFCGSCGSPVVSELSQTAGIIAVKAVSLERE